MGLYSQRARKNRDPPSPRTNRAGVQKEGEKGKTSLTTTLTTTLTSLVVVCVFKTLSQTREAIQNASFFKRRLSVVVVLFKRAKRANASRAKRTRRPKTSSGRKVARPSLARMVCALFLESFLGQSRSRHTHTREREKDSYFFLGLCTDYIPLSCLYREVKSKTCRLNFCRRKGVLGTKVLVEVLPSLVTSSV